MGGKQGIHSHTMTQNIEALHAISREYHMERLWMAAKDAADLGVQTGDTVRCRRASTPARWKCV